MKDEKKDFVILGIVVLLILIVIVGVFYGQRWASNAMPPVQRHVIDIYHHNGDESPFQGTD